MSVYTKNDNYKDNIGPYSTAPDTLTRQPSHIHHNNQWIFKDIQAYNLLL